MINSCDREELSLCKELTVWKLGSCNKGTILYGSNWKSLILSSHNLHYIFHLSELSLNLEPGYNRLVCREEGTKLYIVMAHHFSQLYSPEKRKTQLKSCPSSWPLTYMSCMFLVTNWCSKSSPLWDFLFVGYRRMWTYEKTCKPSSPMVSASIPAWTPALAVMNWNMSNSKLLLVVISITTTEKPTYIDWIFVIYKASLKIITQMCEVAIHMTIWMRDLISRERNDLAKITVLRGCLAVPGSLYSPVIFTTEGASIWYISPG